MQNFTVKFIFVYTSQRPNVCINCTDGTNESKSNGALNNPWRGNPSVKLMIKWEKNDVNSYLLCSGGRWSLKIEDQSQKKEMKHYKLPSVKYYWDLPPSSSPLSEK